MKRNILYLSGNYESQRIALLDNKDEKYINEQLRIHFVYSCLLAEKVVQPVGHVFQSESMRNITKQYQPFFFL